MTKALRATLSIMAALASSLSATETAPPPAGSPVARHGALRVHGGRLAGESGAPVQLRGMSTAGLQWGGAFVNDASFEALALDWRADLVRLAMYVGEGGYATNPSVKATLIKGIELAIRHGLYVIVDWHVLTPGDPNDPIYGGAADFFREIASSYGSYPNIIYEIANEPNGSGLSWEDDIRPYAERIVSAIRAIDPDNLIIVGTGTWSQDVDIAADEPLDDPNLAYAVHFYAGSHGSSLRAKIDAALDAGACVFCSEWGTTTADGAGRAFLKESSTWLSFLGERGISWANWCLGPGAVGSATFKMRTPAAPTRIGPGGIAAWKDDRLSESGAYVRAILRGEGP